MRQDYVIDIDDAKIQKVGRVKDNPYPEQSRSFFSSDVVASGKILPSLGTFAPSRSKTHNVGKVGIEVLLVELKLNQ
jgi:hypothetical protein